MLSAVRSSASEAGATEVDASVRAGETDDAAVRDAGVVATACLRTSARCSACSVALRRMVAKFTVNIDPTQHVARLVGPFVAVARVTRVLRDVCAKRTWTTIALC